MIKTPNVPKEQRAKTGLGYEDAFLDRFNISDAFTLGIIFGLFSALAIYMI